MSLGIPPGPWYAANLAALKARQPSFVPTADDDRVQSTDGTWRLVENGRAAAIHSRDPQREADTQVATLFEGGRTPSLIVTIGLGLGYLLDGLDRHGWTGTVIALEPEPATVTHLLARRDLRPWVDSGRLRLLVVPGFAGSSDCQSLLGDGDTVPPVYVNHALARLRPAAIEQAKALVRRLCHEARANADARRTLGGRYLLNTVRNAAAIAREADAATLFDAARNVPAVIVAAGPSLDRALPVLGEVRGSALLIAVDTALRPLLSAGIAPDIVVAVDPSENNAQHLTDLPPCPETFLVAEGSVDPFAVAGFRGRTFFFNVADHQPWPWLHQHGRRVGRLRAWGSVLTTTFDLALRMGCGPIVFAGADLAYTHGRPYCRGTAFEDTWRRRHIWGQPLEHQWAKAIEVQSPLEEPDVHGHPTQTAPHLLAFRNWLLEQMRRDGAKRFVNVTGGGILHGDSIRQLPLDRLRTFLDGTGPPRAGVVRERYRPATAPSVLDGLRALADSVPGDGTAPDVTLAAWTAFADGLTRRSILDAAAAALRDTGDAPKDGTPNDNVAIDAQVLVERDVLRQLAAATPLVHLTMAPVRLMPAADGARVFRFRTTGARAASATWRCWNGAVHEDGRPLVRVFGVDRLQPGTYALHRDEIHLRASDGSDARVNGRRYTLLVPGYVSFLEQLPLAEILRHDL